MPKTLRRERRKRKLRTGFTTGTAAAAAAKAALFRLITCKTPANVTVQLLTGDSISIPIRRCELETPQIACCTVIKDAGDDPDVTHRAEIGARVWLEDGPAAPAEANPVTIIGGKGVGIITKPGLEIGPGQAAINPGPRKMITQAVADLCPQTHTGKHIKIEIFVPKGEDLARKTLNARLGIVGGLSILGTTGIVKPMSHDAYIATIRSALSVARACGVKQVVLTTGRRSERFAQKLWPSLPQEAFIQIGDFFKMSLQTAERHAFKKISLAVFFGKALKMAQGVAHTHASRSSLTLGILSGWSRKIYADPELAQIIAEANTARHALDLIHAAYPKLIDEVGRRIIYSARKFARSSFDIQSVIFHYDGTVLFDSHKPNRINKP